MKFVNTLTLMCLAFAYSNAMKDIPSKELVKDIKIGWNLGNTLDAHCLDTLDYSEDTLASETCWGNPKATPELFQKLHSLGFNTFRIPTTFIVLFVEVPEYKIYDAWMKRVHEVVDYAINTGSQNEPRKNGDPVEWTGGDQEGWDFVNELDNIFYETVRASGGNNAKRHLMLPPYASGGNNAKRHLMLPPYAAGAYGGAPEHLKYPENDDKIIVSIHAYSPYSFCLDIGEGAVTEFTDASEIDSTMASISENFLSKGVPVIMGEFGAMNRHNDDERQKWAEYYIKSYKSIGIAYPKLVTGLMNGLGDYDYQIPESDILEQVDEEPSAETEAPVSTVAEPVEPASTVIDPTLPPKTVDTLPVKTPEPVVPNPSGEPTLPPKTVDTLPVKTPEPVVPNPSAEPTLPPKTVDTLPVKTSEPVIPNPSAEPTLPAKTVDSLPAKTIAPVVPNPSAEPTLPPKTVDTLPVKTPAPINPPEQSQAASEIDPSYFTCDKDDWKCKSEKSDLCFKEASSCWGSGKDDEACVRIGNECNKIWI
eukprot:jgi/Orpsp1_1/1174076/evm.model.c7180000048833.1